MTAPFLDVSTIRSLTALADSGELRLTDEVASACVKACDALLDELDALRRQSRDISTPAAYGILASAQQLGAKFERKAMAPAASTTY